MASKITAQEFAGAQRQRAAITSHMLQVLWRPAGDAAPAGHSAPEGRPLLHGCGNVIRLCLDV